MKELIELLTLVLTISLSVSCGYEMAEGKFTFGFICWILGVFMIIALKILLMEVLV